MRRQTMCARAYTLTEIVIVLAVITVLAALLFPVFAFARAQSRRATCITNLHQLGTALSMYREDYDELPPHLSTLYPGYVSQPRLFVCPNDPKLGQYVGNERLEGTKYFPTGVSYDYVPQWQRATELGWWQPAPDFGPGKWGDLTPVAQCQWHWATQFNPQWTQNASGAQGWVQVLMMSGSVRKIRVEDSLPTFDPEKYQ